MEKCIYDTNVLINLWKSKIRKLNAFTTIFNIIEFPKALLISHLTVLYPIKEDYLESINIAKDLLKIGKPVGATDILIASIALRHNYCIATYDKDFEYIKQIRPKLKIRNKPTNES